MILKDVIIKGPAKSSSLNAKVLKYYGNTATRPTVIEGFQKAVADALGVEEEDRDILEAVAARGVFTGPAGKPVATREGRGPRPTAVTLPREPPAEQLLAGSLRMGLG